MKQRLNRITIFLEKEKAEKEEISLHNQFKEHPVTGTAIQAADKFSQWTLSNQKLNQVNNRWKRIPPADREKIYNTVKNINHQVHNAIMAVGSFFSGTTNIKVMWGDKCEAGTYTSQGAQYSGRCKYHKTDAVHYAKVCPEWSVGLVDFVNITNQSMRDSCPLIGLNYIKDIQGNQVFEAIWTKGKKFITEQKGWIAARGTVLFHSVKSEEHALKGLNNKVSLQKNLERQKKYQQEGRGALWGQKEIKLKEVQLLTGWCSPGCKQWLSHNIGGKQKAKYWEVAQAARQSGDHYGEKLLGLMGLPKETFKYSNPNPHTLWT